MSRPRPKLLEQLVFGLAAFLACVLAYYVLTGKGRLRPAYTADPLPLPAAGGSEGDAELPPPDTSGNTMRGSGTGQAVQFLPPIRAESSGSSKSRK